MLTKNTEHLELLGKLFFMFLEPERSRIFHSHPPEPQS